MDPYTGTANKNKFVQRVYWDHQHNHCVNGSNIHIDIYIYSHNRMPNTRINKFVHMSILLSSHGPPLNQFPNTQLIIYFSFTFDTGWPFMVHCKWFSSKYIQCHGPLYLDFTCWTTHLRIKWTGHEYNKFKMEREQNKWKDYWHSLNV